jgi:hypothetical protein
MNVCQQPEKYKRLDCIACNGGAWFGVYPPSCICDKGHALTIGELPPYGHYCPNPEMHLKENETITIKKALWDEMLGYKTRIENAEKFIKEFCHDTLPSIGEALRELQSDVGDLKDKTEGLSTDILEQNSFMDDFNKRIEKLESYPLENGSIVFTTIIERIEKLENLMPDVLMDFEKRIVKLEEAYKGDAEVAKDIIFDGARRNEEINKLKEKIVDISKIVNAIYS